MNPGRPREERSPILYREGLRVSKHIFLQRLDAIWGVGGLVESETDPEGVLYGIVPIYHEETRVSKHGFQRYLAAVLVGITKAHSNSNQATPLSNGH